MAGDRDEGAGERETKGHSERGVGGELYGTNKKGDDSLPEKKAAQRNKKKQLVQGRDGGKQLISRSIFSPLKKTSKRVSFDATWKLACTTVWNRGVLLNGKALRKMGV